MSSEDQGVVCRLIPVKDENYSPEFPIDLQDGEPVVLGRNPATGIKDKRLSRHQVEVTADLNKKVVKCKQLGSNPCLVSKAIFAKDEVGELTHGSTLHLLLGRFQYRVEFSNADNHSVNYNGEQNSSTLTSSKQDGGVGKTLPTNAKTKKRPMSNDGGTLGDMIQEAKRSKIEDSDVKGEDSDEEEDDIDKKLQQLRKKAKEHTDTKPVETKPTTSSSKPSCEEGTSGEGASNMEKKGPEILQQGKPWSAGPKWEEHGRLVVHTCDGVRAGNWIAGFDMDGTIITTQSGKVFPTSISDWRILYPDVPGKLKKLHAQGFKVVFFTNQLGVFRGKTSLADMKQKVTYIIKKLGVPIQVLMATGPGIHRKPAVGMWTYILNKANDGIAVDMTTSLYCGDAAGRPKDWKPKTKKDFSCSDRLFAMNVGLKFYTPEEYFLGGALARKAQFDLPPFNPKLLSLDGPLLEPASTVLLSPKQEVLILVGFPASGKSTFVKNHLLDHKYVHVNRDTMGTWQKCVSASTAALNRGQSVVVDNTNPDRESRNRYIECAKKAGVKCRCFVFKATMEQAKHNERFRQISDTVKDHATIRDMVYYAYRNKYMEPSTKEGIDEVVKVNFVPKFAQEKDRKLYMMWLLEK